MNRWQHVSRRRWRRTRTAILHRDHHRCHKCGAPATQVDHLKPLSQGGSAFDPRNLAAVCAPCNLSAGGKLGAQRQLIQRLERKVWAGAINPEG